MSTEERRIALEPGHIYGRHAAVAYPLLVEHGRKLTERGVAFTDLTQVFADVEEPVYRDSCCHLNDRGQELLLRQVVSTIGAANPASGD